MNPALGGVPLGRTGLRVSALGLGTAPLGNLFSPVSDRDADATVRAALDAGITYLDTAPHYGLGIAERRLGRVLAGLPRDAFVLSTKVGRLVRPLQAGEAADPEGYVTPPGKRVWDLSRDGVRRSLEESLQRLGLDRVDVAFLHDPDDHERQAYRDAFPALAELRDQGVVRAIGAGMNQAEMLARTRVRAPPSTTCRHRRSWSRGQGGWRRSAAGTGCRCERRRWRSRSATRR